MDKINYLVYSHRNLIFQLTCAILVSYDTERETKPK
jgi:hypothetical protein